jgi:hypothetical protein
METIPAVLTVDVRPNARFEPVVEIVASQAATLPGGEIGQFLRCELRTGCRFHEGGSAPALLLPRGACGSAHFGNT